MNRKFTGKALALVMALAMLLSVLPIGSFAAGRIDYTIINPYENVDWGNWGQYKANLHTHSTVSDGRETFATMVETHYELGYDILAMTDHGTIDKGWTNLNTNPGITFVMNIKRGTPDIQGLTTARYEQISTGADRGGRGLVRVPFGIEHNAASFNNTHVNSFFCFWGDGYLGGTSYYDHILKGVEGAGGICVINHPGEYTGAKEFTPEEAYNPTNLKFNYIIRKFTHLFTDYQSCIGMEVVNKDDSRTRNDRKLWDTLLANVIPTGRNIFAFANSDAHSISACDTNWEVMVMPVNNPQNIRACMEKGAFFAASHNIKNPKEVARLEAETGLSIADENGYWFADRSLPEPKVTEIRVDNRADTISITAENHKTIHWIANGEVIQVGGFLDLNEHSDKIGSYVRAEIWGERAILYSQPFILEYKGAPTAKTFIFF
ncbi:MAG TPA: hypothetical protein P5127_02695, partial [Oscillospiraceae bacterium]|nr:hypothetical protein [Oscillospiraceae bacterium]